MYIDVTCRIRYRRSHDDPTRGPAVPSIELDYVDDDLAADASEDAIADNVRAWLAGAGLPDVTFTVKEVAGPAGGAPVLNFTAPTDERMRDFLNAYDGGDDMDDLIERVRADA